MSNEKKNEISDIIKLGQELLEKQQNKELYDNSYLYDYINIQRELKSNLQKASESGRKLIIGVIGAVKAGKSSFLNALLFDGEQYLPKAITPSTATLTKITYSDTPKAIVHFFDKEDWNQIEQNVAVYEGKLNDAYNNYCMSVQNSKNQRKNTKNEEKNSKNAERKLFASSD